MVYKIIKYPDVSLRVPTQLVEWPLSKYMWEHIRDMQDTLDASSDGAALASNQISGHGYRIFIVGKDLAKSMGDSIFINPMWEAVANSGMLAQSEGCLSFPGLSFSILRYKTIQLKYTSINGEVVEKKFSGFEARVIQHECDHLDGKLFIEQLDKRKQIEVRNEVIKRKKAGRW